MFTILLSLLFIIWLQSWNYSGAELKLKLKLKALIKIKTFIEASFFSKLLLKALIKLKAFIKAKKKLRWIWKRTFLKAGEKETSFSVTIWKLSSTTRHLLFSLRWRTSVAETTKTNVSLEINQNKYDHLLISLQDINIFYWK